MQEPCLVILAAGMGSRFGGLKQITAVDELGHAIIDFSLYDAYRAGFRKVVFIIKREIEQDFRQAVGRRAERYFQVEYVYQQLDMLPPGYAVPKGRRKPWGTAHAVLCAAGAVDGPFAVINADDFYGPGAYGALYEFLRTRRLPGEQAMVAYQLKNTVTEHGSVARGICSVENGLLTSVVERTRIEKRGEDAAYTEDGEHWLPLSGQLPVSMNFWGFSPEMMNELAAGFPAWLDGCLENDPLGGEYFLPFVVNGLIESGRGSVRVLNCREVWHGITYREDTDSVVRHIAALREKGVYPGSLLD